MLLLDVEQFNLENQSFVGLDASVGCSVSAISEVGGHNESSLATLTEQHETFAETGNDTLEVEGCRAAAFAAVEYFAVDVLAGVVDNYGSVLGGSRSFAGVLDKVCKTCCSGVCLGVFSLEFLYVFLPALTLSLSAFERS